MAGYLGLFASAFLAATVLPFSSEAVLAGLVGFSGNDALLLWLTASVGNTLGAAVNWVLGRYCLEWRDRRWFPVNAAALERASRWFRRWGVWSLLFAWLPLVGDPLTFAAGLLRVNFWLFLALAGTGKAARYAAVVLAAQGVFGS